MRNMPRTPIHILIRFTSVILLLSSSSFSQYLEKRTENNYIQMQQMTIDFEGPSRIPARTSPLHSIGAETNRPNLNGLLVIENKAADPTAEHEVIFQLKQRNEMILRNLLDEVSAPRMKRKYLTREEVASLTANPNGAEAVEEFLKSHGNKISWYDMGPTGEYVRARATIATWNEILQADFREFEVLLDSDDRLESQKLHRTVSYFLPRYVADHIETVHNTVQILPRRTSYPTPRKATSNAHNGPDYVPYATFPSIINEAYGIPSNSNGSARSSQGIVSMLDDNFSLKDLQTFSKKLGIPPANVINVGGHDSDTICNLDPGKCAEPSLDMQYLHAMSWDSNIIRIYADDPLSWLLNISAMDNPPLVNSISYGYIEADLSFSDPFYMKTFDREAIKLGLRGVTLIASSGDDGVASFLVRGSLNQCAYVPTFPASSSYVTVIGGTQGPEIMEPERAASCFDSGGKGAGIVSGGGFSNINIAPYYQSGLLRNYLFSLPWSKQPLFGYTLSGRGYPDLSILSSNFAVTIDGEMYYLSGTSASAPTFAGMVSLVNAARIKAGKGPIGFLNPAIYQYSAKFTRDIKVGSNHCASGNCSSCCSQGFYASDGWDPVSKNILIFMTTYFSIVGVILNDM